MKRTFKRSLSALSVITALALLAGVFALPAAAAADTAGYAAEVVRLVNAERAADGRRALANTNSKLNAAAQKRAQEIAVKYSHERPDGSGCFTVFTEHGLIFGAAGENIAVGEPTPAWVVTAWMNSPEHRSLILGLEANFNQIGAGVYEREDGTLCWSLLFINDYSVPVDPGAGKIAGGGTSHSSGNGGGSVNIFTRIWSWIKGFISRIADIFQF